jgi:hypothetical protein
MSSVLNPNIITSGLLSYYDASNTSKSWHGKPTTNLVLHSDGLDATSWAGYCGNMSNLTWRTTETTAPDGSYNAVKVVRDSNGNCGAGTCWGLFYNASGTFTAGITYTISIWLKCSTGNVTVYLGPNDSQGTGIGVTTTWQRFSYAGFTTTSLDRGLQFIVGGASTVYAWGAQVEVGSFATPYVSSGSSYGTRTASTAFTDLAHNTTATINSLQYASDNTFSFNGVADNIDLGTSLYAMGIRRSATFSAWIKPADTLSVYAISDFGLNSLGMTLRLNSLVSSDFYVYPTNHRITYTPASNFVIGTWYNIVGVMDSANMYLYFNGEMVGSQTLGEDIGLTSASLKIGSRGDASTGVFGSGYVNSVIIYNRALSDSEIKQNFNATRGRYGL